MIKEKHFITIEDGSEDGLDLEETRYPYYNDNLDLIGYTSELRDKNDKFFAFVDFNADDDRLRIRECPHCLEYEIHNKLGPKIKKKDEPRAPDDEQFLSCYSCGNTFGIHETHFDSKIKDSIQTTSNPFDNESTFLSTETTATKRRKRDLRDSHRRGVHKYRSKRIDYDKQEDPDIQREIDTHGTDNVRIIR
jgi:hypothetical protein